MELIGAAALTLLSLVSALPLLLKLRRGRKKPPSSKQADRKLPPPPGPWNLPLIGSILHLVRAHPQVALRDLAHKYGPVVFLRMGQIDTVVVSSAAVAEEVLREKDITFASRPSLLVSEIFCYGNLDIGFAPYGAYWRTLRKLCTVELLSAKMVRQIAPIRDQETLSLVAKIQAASAGGRPVNLAGVLLNCSNTITAKAAFGQACSGDMQEQFLSALAVALTFSGGFTFGDLFPSLRFVDAVTGLRRRMWRAHWQLDAVFDKIIEQCQQQPGDSSLVSVLLRIKDAGELEFPIATTNIKAIILDMFTGGTETTSSAAEWAMAELIRCPEAMAKAQAEVRRVLDNKSPQEHEGLMDELPYTRNVIKETFRLNPVVPLLVPRVCRATCDIGGFEVQEGTRVMINAWAMARSPEYWQDPERFWPERFEDGKVDYKGSQFQFLPFGGGRRRCPGDTFGLAVLELTVARLLYYIDWSLPEGTRAEDIDMDMSVASTTRKKNPLHLVATPYRVPPVQA